MPSKYILKYLLQQGEVGKNRYENWGMESLNSVYSYLFSNATKSASH